MATTCSIRPKVRSRNGQLVDSELGNDLIEASGYDLQKGWSLYRRSKDKRVVQAIKESETAEYDTNGEPTLTSLMDVVDFGDNITEQSVLAMLTNRLNEGVTNKGDESEMLSQIQRFNSASPYRRDYIAGLDRDKKGQLRIAVYSRTDESSLNGMAATQASKELHERLVNLLNKAGVNIGVLTDLERRMGVNGVTDFENIRKLANGMIDLIRLRDDAAGAAALPEEFSHAAIRMLRNEPIVQRLIASLSEESKLREIFGEQYERYLSEYKNDMALMSEEAAGKLLASALKGENLLGRRQPTNLLSRIWEAVKMFLGRFDLDGLIAARDNANAYASRLAQDILSERLKLDASTLDGMDRGEVLYNIASEAKVDFDDISRKISLTLMKRATIARRLFDARVGRDQKTMLARLEGTRMTDNALLGILDYLRQSYNEMDTLLTILRNKKSLNAMDNNRKADVLREIKLMVESIEHMSPYMMDVIQDVDKWSKAEQKLWAKESGEKIEDVGKYMSTVYNEMLGMSKVLEYEYRRESESTFKATIRSFLGTEGREMIVNGKNVLVTADNIMELVKNDIGLISRWMDSANDTNNLILNILDQTVKAKRYDAREYMIKKRKEIVAIGLDAEKEGLKNFGFLYQKDSEGKKTGYYITEIDWNKVQEAKEAKLEELKAKYPNDVARQNRAYQNWLSTICSRDAQSGRFTVDLNKTPQFRSAEYERLTPVQKKYAERLYVIKREFDAMLPSGLTQEGSTIKILKDDLERIKDAKSMKDVMNIMKSFAKDKLYIRSDDSEYGSDTILKDFSGKKINTVRTRFTHLDNKDSEDDVSEDIISSLVAYGAMASDFATINDIVGELENARDYVKDNFRPQMTRGEQVLHERFKIGGREISDTAVKEATLLSDRINDFMEMQVYGNMHKDEGTIGKTNISVGKVADTVNWYTSLCTYALNLCAGISNVATGVCMMNIEAFCQEHFKLGDLLKADAIYNKEILSYISEIGNRQRNSKLYLFDEMFNVSQDYESSMRETAFNRKTWLTQLLNKSPLFFLNNSGEHWMSNRTALAMALNYKLKDRAGNIVSLWEALQVVPNNPNNPAAGSRLEVREGLTKVDGTDFTRNDIYRLGEKIKAVNESMHGIYNEADRNAIQQYGVGRMAIMFRKWIYPSIKRRFGSRKVNLDLDMEQEGYYRTVWNFAMDCARDYKNGAAAIAANWKKLSDHQKKNFLRAGTEILTYVLLLSVMSLVGGGGDDDKGHWWKSMLRYQMHRLRTELGVLIPGPQMLTEGLRILKSPAAALQTGQHVLEMTRLLNPFNYELVGGDDAVIQAGRWKGWTRAEKTAFQLLPVVGPVSNAKDVEYQINFFMNN